jgi:signal transduction histidine kinase/CheY-like chemotaxis protein
VRTAVGARPWQGASSHAPEILAKVPSGTVRALWILTTTVVLVPVLLFGAAALLDRSAVLQRAEHDGRKTLALLHEQAANQLSGHEIILDAIVDRVNGQGWDAIGASRNLLRDLESMDKRLDDATEILLVDDTGRVRATTVHGPGPPPVPDVGCFTALRDGNGSTCVSAPHLEPVTGRRLFSLSRRLQDGGTFKGVAQVAVSVDYFLDLWGTVARNPSDSIILLRADGTLLARYPEHRNVPARFSADYALVVGMQHGNEGMIRGRSPIDGYERSLAYLKVSGYPVYIAVGIDRGAALAEWYHNLVVYGLVALAVTLALVVAAGTALRRAHRERRAIALWRAEVKERETAQAQLLQSQKMESIGQLTGGVAHDFNNLLTAVIGNIDMALSRTNEERTHRLLQGALGAAESGVSLTQRLLAFARKQLLQPMSVDLRRLVSEIEDLLVRTLGPRVQLTVSAAPGLWPALVDRNQLELIVLNLAINSRDAMPRGGALTITLSNRSFGPDAPVELAVGDYVVLAVTDTGMGMDEATLARAFEPFFTTKEVGKGTGLGLSMMHGIVVQSGGATRIRSKPGEGTTVEIWLPRAATAPVEMPPPARKAVPVDDGVGTILLCDDDPTVCAFVAASLEDAGYRVRVTESGRAALAALEDGSAVDLLLVDFAMPELNGAAVACLVRERHPHLPILLITGYADQGALTKDAREVPILHKPFKQADLVARVMALLPRDGDRRARAAGRSA